MSTLPRGHFERILVMDCETSGLAWNTTDPSYDTRQGKSYQSVSWGLIVADAQTLKPIDELYIELKHNPDCLWNDKAEAVHGLSKDYLNKNGMDEEDAVAEIAGLVYTHWGTDKLVPCAGHNVSTFDICFMRRLLTPHEVMFKTGNRFIDTNTIGFACYGTFNSDDLFELMGVNRDQHNALEDAKASLVTLYNTRRVYDTLLG